jgi:hypothetical protein
MARRMSRAQRRDAFLAEANKMFEAVEAWYDDHPDASFGEIEQEARVRRRAFMGQALAILVNGRDTGQQIDPPRCRICSAKMDFEDYRDWTLHGLEGDTTLERAYYVCPRCEREGLFPPGQQTEAAPRSSE